MKSKSDRDLLVRNRDDLITHLETGMDDFAGRVGDVALLAGKSDRNVHLANEREIYSVFFESVREMPAKLNQWCLVDRKELDPIPLLRCFKFPYQKAYSAFATKIEADTDILEILELYRQIFEEFLAVPIIKGKASELEKLANGLYTATVEVFIPNSRWNANKGGELDNSNLNNAWGVRGATAHCLGEKAMGWVNCWSCSIRAIGIMVMVHGDYRGLMLPPKVAPVQVIVVPGFKKSDVPGIQMPAIVLLMPCVKQLLALRRDNCAQVPLLRDSVAEQVNEILDDIQTNLFEAAKSRQEACIRIVKRWDEFVKVFKFHSAKIVLAPWCDDEEVEKNVKSRIDFESFGLEVKTLCSPLEQPDIPEGTPCFFSGKPAKKWTYWGQSY
ncbi:hypothetical protein Ddye_012280 [Dipteronia dyeriana]|uniref:Proline-tRNA ligase class II C-terminal domain-containing protein n=1 Tax=Dipteronia dyeriana TaxID=168575 RepID=A0AAD9X468_9ROSI|nr:hypothetical protein Ddye_012280 [Dipteronia dyeriana]